MKTKKIISLLTTAAAVVTMTFNTSFSTSSAEERLQYDRSDDLLVSADQPLIDFKADALVYSEIPVESFQVSNLSPSVVTDIDYTDWWFSEWEDCRYVFLPATADRKDLVITYSADDTIYLNDTPVKSGEKTSILSESDTFTLKVGKKDCGTLKVMQSNLGCIYLATENGTIDYLDTHWWIEEKGSVLVLDEKGKNIYNGEIDELKRHGNSSWDYSKKKSYNLKLPKKIDMYGMGKAKKWVLLSNYIDHSMMRDKLTEEMCKAAGMDYVGDSTFVDLYADGAYRGTYQLCEKVQVQKNRVNITDLEEITEKLNGEDLDEYPQKVVGAESASDYPANSYKYFDIPKDPDDITGGYLMQFQIGNRYGYKSDSGFVTSRGQVIQIDSPEHASKAQVEYIRSFVQDMEDAIYSEDGYNKKGKHYTDYADDESLIKAYLTQEISENIDSTYASFFFWKESDTTGDGKIHFGPPWDFDLAYANFPAARSNSDGKTGYSSRTDNLFTAYFPVCGYEKDNPTSQNAAGRSWLGELYTHEDYVRRAAKTYYKDFKPFLEKLTGGEKPYLTELCENILPSAEMNNARWHSYGGSGYTVFSTATSGKDFMDTSEKVREVIEKRHKWLSELWLPYLYTCGDINNDEEITISDAVILQEYLLGVPGTNMTYWQAADINGDSKINVFDMIGLKELLTQSK